MKIAIVSILFSGSRGGSVSVAYEQARALKGKGHEIFLFVGTPDGSDGWFEEKGFRIYKTKIKESRYIFRNYICLYGHQKNKEFKDFLSSVNPDVVHFHNLYYQLPFSLIKIAKKSASKVFLTVHDVMLIHYGKFIPRRKDYLYKINFWEKLGEAGKSYNPFRQVIFRYYLSYVDKIFAVSNSFKKLLEINGINNVETIYNGTDIDDWVENKSEIQKFKEENNLLDKKVLFFGARLGRAKGGEELLKALALIKKDIKNIILVVAGEKNKYYTEMKELAHGLGIESNVVFAGWLMRDGLNTAYHSADVCIFPSLCFETFGMFVLEAMACKKPVVSSFFGGPTEVVVDGATGYLIDPNNVELLAEKIIDLIKNPDKARKFGEAGYRRVKEIFSLDKKIEEILKWYKL